jgi:ADP-ribosyl-[dinitrogen reductase] hydrolase
VLAAANLGDDADTTAAIVGQLAGSFYGANAIPITWRTRLATRSDIEDMARQLFVRFGQAP